MSDPKRIKHINFRVTDEEYREIEQAAAASGDESNNWCRKLALSAAREGRRRRALRHAGVQPLDPRRAEERDRLGVPAVGDELVRPEAVQRAPGEGAEVAVDKTGPAAIHDERPVIAAVPRDTLGSAGRRSRPRPPCDDALRHHAAAVADLIVGIGHDAG